MNTALIVLALISSAFVCIGIFSIFIENKFTEFFEYFVQVLSPGTIALTIVNTSIASALALSNILSSTQAGILLACSIVQLALFGLIAYKYLTGKMI